MLYYSMSGAPAGPISMLPLLPWSVGVGIIGGISGKRPTTQRVESIKQKDKENKGIRKAFGVVMRLA